MSAIYVTMPGWIATKPERLTSSKGVGAKFRVASTERWFDRAADAWNKAQPVYVTVTCWRQLAESVLLSLRIGDPVLVHGKLINAGYERDGRSEVRLEISAAAVGPDLRWSTAVVTRTRSAAADSPERVGPDGDGVTRAETTPSGAAAPPSGDPPAAAGRGSGSSTGDRQVGVLAGEGAVRA
jgi:single-strand DNA-binding protein